VARYAAEAGADFLVALNAGLYRNLGTGSLASFLPYGNANDQTEALLREHILPHAGGLPTVAGVLTSDPTRPLRTLLRRLRGLGVQGIINWPAVGLVDGQFRRCLEAEGMGVEAEAALLAEARALGLVTIGYAVEEDAVNRFVAAGVDALILAVGLTQQVDDVREKRDQLQLALGHVNRLLKVARQGERPPLCLAYGGPITAVEDLEELFRHSPVDGFVGGSVFERLPVQSIVTSTVRLFKSVRPSPVQVPAGDEFGGMIGRTPVMRELFEAIRRVAPYDVNVCLEGETGTGKELVAAQIHRLSQRARQPFVAMNCGAIPESLLESELFGHEKGAFTHADRRRLGKFELAHQGTLFLDEIADLSPRGQVALLRAIQQREITRVGGEQPVPVNVRILAASNRNLAPLVAEGRFRADLYHRLNNITLTVPPLRDRLDDIPLLAEAILARLCIQLNRMRLTLSTAFHDALNRHDWPGNVRELEHVLGRAALLEDGPVLHGKSFLPRSGISGTADGDAAPRFQHQPRCSRRTLARRAVEDATGNKSRAAAQLGISRKTLYQWLREEQRQ
jgi:two-component system response regulator HydG